MVITYTKNYKEGIAGIGWQLYSCVSFEDTLIVRQLLNFVTANPSITFDNMYDKLKEIYRNKTVKSRCDIIKDNDRIEVIVKGVFPKFYIEKIQNK